MRHVEVLPAVPTREKLLPPRCLDGAALSDGWCQPREGFSLGSLQTREGHRGDAQLWVQGQHSLAWSCHQPQPQLLRRGESAAAWEKRLEVVAGWPWPGWNPRCPSGCRGLAGSVCPVPVRQGGLVCLECAAKTPSCSSNKCHELLTSTVSSGAKCNSVFF